MMSFNLATAPRGADLSRYQQRPSFQRLADDGISFVYIKAWQGDAPDPDFLFNVAAAEKAGMPWFWYLFASRGDTVKTLTDCAKFVAAPKVAGIIDWETAGVPSADVELSINELVALGNRPPMVYRGVYPPAPVTPLIATCPWVLAEYTSGQPRAPAWDGVLPPDWSKEWLIWQNSGAGRLGGIATAIDLDVLACPLAALTQWRDTGVFPQAA